MMKTIPLSKNKFAIVDDVDYERVNALRWYARQNETGNWYAATTMRMNGRRRQVHMHRFILNIEQSDTRLIDHADGDGLNNQRTNLRFATLSQNSIHSKKRRGAYTSNFKGVSWHKAENRWRAEIGYCGKIIRLGRLSTRERRQRHII